MILLIHHQCYLAPRNPTGCISQISGRGWLKVGTAHRTWSLDAVASAKWQRLLKDHIKLRWVHLMSLVADPSVMHYSLVPRPNPPAKRGSGDYIELTIHLYKHSAHNTMAYAVTRSCTWVPESQSKTRGCTALLPQLNIRATGLLVIMSTPFVAIAIVIT